MKRTHEENNSSNESKPERKVRRKQSRRSDSSRIELENHFIIRFPKDLTRIVTEAIREGNINEILTIKMDHDMRYGEVRLLHHFLYCKCFDLPALVESYKTADSVNLYKTADISQLLVCQREPIWEYEKELDIEVDIDLDEDKDKDKDKDKDTDKNIVIKEENKTPPSAIDEELTEITPLEIIPVVDMKFLWPDGLTPPLRHLRKRRLNIALRDKNLEQTEPDVVKDVRYLLRMDSEAERIEFEVIGDDVKTDYELSDSFASGDTDTEILDDDDYLL